MVTIHSQTREITRSGQYWAFSHFSRFIKRGARHLDSQGDANVAHAAFEHADGTRVVVLANSGAAQPVQMRVGAQSATLNLSGNSVATLVW